MKRFPTLLFPALLTAVFLTLGATPVRAQATLSLLGGVNRTSLSTDADGASRAPVFESLTRMSIGLAATLPVSDRFGLQLGGRYAQKGGRLDVLGVLAMMGDVFGEFEDMPPGASFDADYEMNFVELSALARIGFPLSDNRVSGHLLAGPALGLRSSCEAVVRLSGLDEPPVNVSSDCDEGGVDLGTIDVGLAGGRSRYRSDRFNRRPVGLALYSGALQRLQGLWRIGEAPGAHDSSGSGVADRLRPGNGGSTGASRTDRYAGEQTEHGESNPKTPPGRVPPTSTRTTSQPSRNRWSSGWRAKPRSGATCSRPFRPTGEGYRYAPGKWSIREVVGHVIDAERMFSVRAMAFARGDASHYPSFDENDYAAESGADQRTLADLAEELSAVRTATLLLLRSFPEDAWNRRGVASGYEFTVRSLAWIIAGHSRHHRQVLMERYLA